MARRWVRIAITLTTLVAVGFAGKELHRSELALDDQHSVERVFTDLSWALTLALGDLRAAQQAYVAAGQDRGYWTSRVDSHLDTVRNGLENLGRLARDAASIEALKAAEATIADLDLLDQRAREHTDLQQQLLASDLIFSDGLELTSEVAAHVDLARSTERNNRSVAIRSLRTDEVVILGAATGLGLLTLLILTPVTRQRGRLMFGRREGREATVPPAENATRSSDRLVLSNADLDAPDHGSEMEQPAAPEPDSGRALEQAETTAPEPLPDLRAAAALCTDLSTLADTSGLPALLARAAELMNASGLIIWVRDPSGHALRPALGHGYSSNSLIRLGSISEDGKNATATAFRTAQMQIVDRRGSGNGALAIPLRSVGCCIGVLSAELCDGWESSEAVQANAAIIAAQLATLLPADPPADAAAPGTKAQGY